MATPAVVPQSQPRALSVEAQQDIDGFRALQYAAGIMARSGCFSDIKGADPETAIAKAVVKIAIGRDYGFSVAESMQHIELIQGRPSIAAHARAAKMKAAGYSWKFKKFNDLECSLIVYDPNGEEIGDSSFTLEDAKRMGLSGKDNWSKQPRNMLYCRAISNAQRWYAPEVLSASLASKEEVLDDPSFSRQEPERGVLTIDAFKPSEDANRGHDDASGDGITRVTQADIDAALQQNHASESTEVLVSWPDRAAMTKDFRIQKERLGEERWNEVLNRHDVMLGSAKPDSEKVMACYREMAGMAAE